MQSRKKGYILAGLAVIIVLIVTLVPVVPYALQVNNPGFPYELQGYGACEAEFTVNQSIDVSNPAFQRCIASYLIPPINVTGYGSLSYKLLGIGDQPFPSRFAIGETDFYAILYMDGAKIAAAQEVSQDDVTYDPAGITIINSSLSQGFFGEGNVTVTVTNHSDQTLFYPSVLVSVPGSSGNYTDEKGITWIFTTGSFATLPPSAPLQASPCLTNGVFNNLTSGASCTAVAHPTIAAPFGSPFRYTVEVTGRLGSTPSITKQTYSYSLSPQAANRLWVNTFIQLVNAARGSPYLAESGTLDRFAEQRFNSAVKQPDISDYGLFTDESSFFGANGTKATIVELLLFPTNQSPYTFTTTLQGGARGHWQALMNKSYTYFGYYIGSGPYVSVNLPCPVTEIPQAGINITQYFTSHGCSVSRIPSTTWLVMILGNQ